MQNEENVGVSKKIELFRGYLLIAQTAEFYIDEKKLLKSLHKFISKEVVKVEKKFFPLSEQDKVELFYVLSDLCEALGKLSAAKTVDEFNIWRIRLASCRKNICSEIDKIESTSSQAGKIVEAMVDKAKNVGATVGAAVSEGLKKIKKI